MKIRDAAYSAQLDALREKKRTLSRLLKEQENGEPGAQVFDRVELSRELSETSARYETARGVMEGILSAESAVHNREAAKQQSEAMAEEAQEMSKMMEVYRRIASGGHVPPEDEKKLMEFNHELYMAAKSAALLAQRSDEDYDSLWEDEETPEEVQSASEIAGDTEISVPAPETAEAAGSAAPGAADGTELQI